MQVSRWRIFVAVLIVGSISLALFLNATDQIRWSEGGIVPFQLGGTDGRALADGEITTRKIADSAVSAKKIAAPVVNDIEEGKMAYYAIESGITPNNSTFTPGSGTYVVAKNYEAGDFTDIQSAIDALPENGGTVYVKEGTYELFEEIKIRSSNVFLIGAGTGTTLNQTADNPVVHVGWGAENVLIANFKVNGRGMNPGIYFTGVTQSEVRNVRVKNSGPGIYLKGSNWNFVNNNIVVISKDGIKLHDSHNNVVLGNLLFGNEGYGIYILSSDNNAISNNISRKNDGDGIRTRSGSNNSIATNVCLANAGAGVYLGYSNTANNLVTSNNLSGNGVGARLTCSVENTKLVGNHFSQNLTAYLQDDSDTTIYIDTNDIGDGAITGPKIATDAIGAEQISPDAITTIEIENHTIKSSDLDEEIIEESNIIDGAVTTSKIGDDAISAEKIRPRAINAQHILDGTIGSVKIAKGAVTIDKTSSEVLQSGTEGNIIDLSRKTGIDNVKFPFHFPSKPNVVVSFANIDDKTTLPGTLFVENVTSEGFNVGWVLTQRGTGTADVVWYATLEPQEGPFGTQMLANPSFENPGKEGEKPDGWSFPRIYAENENLKIDENEFVQYKDYYGVEPVEGSYMGRLRFASTSENCWTGLGTYQSVENIDETITNHLRYNVAFLFWSGANNADFAGAVVEVEVKSEGETYRLRYTHGYKRNVWPKSGLKTKYIDVEEGKEMPWQKWISVERYINQDLANEFDEIEVDDEFTIESISLYSLIHKGDAAKTDIYLGWDDISLTAAEK